MEISYDLVLKYLQCREYPEGCGDNKKRAIRNKSKKFMIQDGILFYSAKGKLKHWIDDKTKQKQIMDSCHADKLGGHFGRDKTRDKVSSR